MRYGLLVLTAAIAANVAQAVFTGPAFLGMSGVGLALFGYVWMKTMYAPEEGMYVSGFFVAIVLIGFFLGFTQSGPYGRTANMAHLAGLAIGIAVAYAPIMFRQANGGR